MKSDMPVNDLSVVYVADTVQGVAYSFGVIIPIAEVERIGLDIAENLGVEFDSAGERFLAVHSPPREVAELIFEVGVLRRVETSAEAGRTFEGDGHNRSVETNRQHVRLLQGAGNKIRLYLNAVTQQIYSKRNDRP